MMRMKKILDGHHGNELEAVFVALLVLEAERAHFREMRPKILKYCQESVHDLHEENKASNLGQNCQVRLQRPSYLQ
jgi:hypothetical protein